MRRIRVAVVLHKALPHKNKLKGDAMLPQLPEEILRVLNMIQQAGGQGYVVGGALRDLLRGGTPTDWDIAATLPSPALLAIFTRSVLIGGTCSTVQVAMEQGVCEITPCHTESGCSDKRQPDAVNFVPDILADLSRRDFTVNAMAFNGEVLLDPFGGQKDLQAKLLRCVGSPAQSFEEDPLRILRLFRLAATLGFTAEWNTFAAANAAMEAVGGLSTEQLRQEMDKILLSGGPQVLGPFIAKGGLGAYGIHSTPVLLPLGQVPARLPYRWWGLFLLCGADSQIAGAAFGFSRSDLALFEELDRLYRLGPSADKTYLKQKLSIARLDYAPAAATFAALDEAFAGEPALYEEIVQSGEPFRLEHLAVGGDTLRLEGLQGPRCGRMLNELLAAVIKTPSLNTVPVLLGMARALKPLLP